MNIHRRTGRSSDELSPAAASTLKRADFVHRSWLESAPILTRFNEARDATIFGTPDSDTMRVPERLRPAPVLR
jgi:hypothetical protein